MALRTGQAFKCMLVPQRLIIDTRGSRFSADTINQPSFSPSRMQKGHGKVWSWSHAYAPPSPGSSPPILSMVPPIMLAVRVLLQVLCTRRFFRHHLRRPSPPWLWMNGAGAESGIYLSCIALACCQAAVDFEPPVARQCRHEIILQSAFLSA